MSKPSLQDVFDAVAVHLLTQGVPSHHYENGCQYRGPAGLKCAVGALITDEAYDPRFEGESAGSMGVAQMLEASGIPTDHDTLNLLEELQATHDTCDPDYWLKALPRIARQFGLSAAVLGE